MTGGPALCKRLVQTLAHTHEETAPIDGPCSQPTDAEDRTLCAVRALAPPVVAVIPPHVRRRLETGLFPLARTCNRIWSFHRRRYILAHRFL